MSMTLKDILNEVLAQSSFLEQDSFSSGTDVDSRQMVAFANRAAEDIVSCFPWNFLRKSTQITLVDGQLSYPLPSDMNQYITESMWKSYGARHVVLPTQERLWGFLKAGNPGTAITYYAKFIQGELAFASVTGGDVINLDYVSNQAIRGANGQLKDRFTQDSDVWLMKDMTLILGTKAYWKLEKEMPSGVIDMQSFKQSIRQDIGFDTPGVVIRETSTLNAPAPYTPPISADYLW